MTRLVDHQLTKLGLSAESPPDAAQWRAFLEQVESALAEDEEDRQTLERTMTLSADETWRLHDGLLRSEARYRLLFEESPLPITLFEPASFQLLAVNDAAVRLYGYSREELLAMKLTSLKVQGDDPDLAACAENATGRGAEGGSPKTPLGPWHQTKKHRRKDGTVFDIDITSHPVTLDGSVVILTIGIEVTETRRLEAQLRQAQKMEAVGQLAGGVAHDFNNILATILSYAELATEDLGTAHPSTPDLLQIGVAAKRAAALTRQLLAFSRQQASQTKALSLNKVVTGMETMLRRLIGEDISVSVVLADDIAMTLADPGQLDQVLLNLAVNARDAMSGGGKLSIRTEDVTLDGPAADGVGVTPGRYAMLAVSDTGSGMDAATQARIFEPFFTTKEVGKGTGLGLSTVYGIVKQAGGGLSVESELGKGATFRVYLPVVPAGVESIPAKPLDPVKGSATVLLVEDEEQVRMVVHRLLTARGYEVVTAPSGAVALEILQARGASIDLLLTDIVMPGMDGRTMAVQALASRPGLRVLYMSGYTEHPTVKGAALGPADHFIQKPFTVQQMADAVRGVLA
jgi:two-component system, cell cycle sensor histidine kinase and response regulator CckA